MEEKASDAIKAIIEAGTTGGDEDEEQIMNEILKQLQSEQPKIDQTLKNFMSIILGKVSSLTLTETKMLTKTITTSSSSSSQTLEPQTAPSSSSSAVSTTPIPMLNTSQPIHYDHFTPTNMMSFAKLLLQSLQETPLPTIGEYTRNNPQLESENLLQYLNRICHYKATYFLRQKMINDKLKISKVFGRLYFTSTNIWPTLKENIFQKIKEMKSSSFVLTNEEMEYLLYIYESSIFGDEKDERSSSISSSSSHSFEDISHYKELIWSNNFQESLQKYQKKRQEAVQNRQIQLQNEEEQKANDDDHGDNDNEHGNNKDNALI